MRLYNVDNKFNKYLQMRNCGFIHEGVLRFGILGLLTRLISCLILISIMPL